MSDREIWLLTRRPRAPVHPRRLPGARPGGARRGLSRERLSRALERQPQTGLSDDLDAAMPKLREVLDSATVRGALEGLLGRGYLRHPHSAASPARRKRRERCRSTRAGTATVTGVCRGCGITRRAGCCACTTPRRSPWRWGRRRSHRDRSTTRSPRTAMAAPVPPLSRSATTRSTTRRARCRRPIWPPATACCTTRSGPSIRPCARNRWWCLQAASAAFTTTCITGACAAIPRPTRGYRPGSCSGSSLPPGRHAQRRPGPTATSTRRCRGTRQPPPRRHWPRRSGRS